MKARLLTVNPDRFSAASILTSLDHVKRRLREAEERRDMPPIEALATCVDLEDGLIERRYFEIIEEDGPELRELLRTLAADTEAHRDKVRQAWERERRGTP